MWKKIINKDLKKKKQKLTNYGAWAKSNLLFTVHKLRIVFTFLNCWERGKKVKPV